MIAMENQNRFTPSVNIIRDLDKPFDYIQTPNTERVLEQLDNNYSAGLHSFNIIGSFGTGKSAFLLTFEKQLLKEEKFFNFSPRILNGSQASEFINIIGSYRSIEDALNEEIKPKSNGRDVLNKLENYYNTLREENKRLVIIVDEFGKFLEFAAANNPEKELYFVQLLCEFANDHSKDILFITTLHQNFQAYTTELNQKQRMEWEKVKGRFKEITFNEPVEQLLFLASKYLQKKTGNKSYAGQEELNAVLLKSSILPLSSQLIGELARDLFPIDMAAAAVLTLSLQKYGQNERSLFSFLKSNDLQGLNDYDAETNPYYNLNCVYNYLMHNFYSFLTAKYNPDYSQWAAIRGALERAEADFENDSDNAARLIKTIGLMSIFASKGARIDKDFLLKYGALSLGIKDTKKIIKRLADRKIIRYQEFKNCFVLYEGTDLDIEIALAEAASYVEVPSNIVPVLKEKFQFPYVLAKAAFFKTGTPRFFEVVFSDQPVKESPKEEVDGFINLVFNESLETEDIKEISKDYGEAILYGLYRSPGEIKRIILDIEKVNYVLSGNTDDLVAQRELKLILSQSTNELNRKIFNSLYANNGSLNWYFKGAEKIIKNRKNFYSLLSEICEQVYCETPHYKNELINRHKVSSNIPVARKLLLDQLTTHWQKEDLGFTPKDYPPERTIYLSLLKNTGMHRKDEEGFMVLAEPRDESFKRLWNRCEAFLESAKSGRKSIRELFDTLSEKPFKLKQGFLEFWIPIFLFIKRDSFASFFEDSYIPYLDTQILLIIPREPGKYFIKAFQIEGIRLELFNKYRRLLDKDSQNRLTNINFIDTICPFLTFYKSLPEYTRKTSRLSPDAVALRDAIAKAKDPEKTFFEDFPNAFGCTIDHLTKSGKDLEEFIDKLKKGLQEIKTCFDELLNRIESFLKKELGLENLKFPGYKRILQERYKTLKPFLLLPHQNSIFNRINSELDDGPTWLKSIIQCVLNKPVERLEDTEEEMVYEKLPRMFAELDNLCELSRLEIDREKEEAIKFEITTLSGGTKSNLIRIPKDRLDQGELLKTKIEKNLSQDKNVNIAALLSLLKEQLKDE